MIALVLGLSFVLLTIAFRSVVVPLKAIVLNLLSIGAAYGLLVLVFQEGVGNELLGLTQAENVAAWVPLFLFAVLFGLSMDYQVFLLSRIRERYQLTGDSDDAVAYGVGSTARLIAGRRHRPRRASTCSLYYRALGLVVLLGLTRLVGAHLLDHRLARRDPGAGALARRRHRHHRVGRRHRRLLRRVLRAAQGRDPVGQDDPLVGRPRASSGPSARSSPPTSRASSAPRLLYSLTVGPVRGFAFFLGLSTVLDVFVA